MRDDEDFDAFYGAWGPRLVRNIYLGTGDYGRAQDCVQEAFIRAWQRWGRLGGSEDPVAWVRTVAWRLACNDWRRVTRQAAALLRRGPDPGVIPPSDEAIAVRDILNRLPPHEGLVIALYYFEDLPIRQIADLLSIPEGTVKTRLFRARASIRESLTMEEEASPWAKKS